MKTIELKSKRHGSHITVVDDVDYERMKRLKNMKWSVVIKRNGLIYFQKRLPGGKLVELHRWIMNPKKGEYVDHIDGNTLDNRRQNLRICTNAANLRNGKIRPNNNSGITGVWRDKSRNKWVAEIKVNYKKISLGRFDNIKDASKARKQAEKKYFSI
jgi:hypothetical protein